MEDEAALAAARRVAAQVLEPDASRAEREGVSRAAIDALAAAGLLAIVAPPALGGVSAGAAREVAEVLAGAGPDAWFVWTQHHMPVSLLTATANAELRERLLPQLCSTTLAAVAFSHLRRPQPGVTATRTPAGWRIDGSVPWLTGWGVADVLALGSLTDTGEVMFALLPLGADTPSGLRPTPPLLLASMQGTRTVGLRLDGVDVPASAVVLQQPAEQWRAADAARAANVVPATFGIARAALDGLRAAGGPGAPGGAAGAPGADGAVELADSLGAALDQVRERAYRLIDHVPAGECLDERVALRAEALRLTLQATAAGVAAQGGKGMSAEHPAQRLARAALFMLVQAQTPELRAATLALLGP